jgi:hypothetical protein
MRWNRRRNWYRWANLTESVWPARSILRAGIMRCIVVRRIGRYWCYIGEGDALRFAEERHQDECSENGALHRDGNCQGAAPNASLASALFGVAIHEAAAQRAETFVRNFVRNSLGLERHHTPPQNFLRGWIAPRSSRAKWQKFCGADFLGVALELQETGAALAGM